MIQLMDFFESHGFYLWFMGHDEHIEFMRLQNNCFYKCTMFLDKRNVIIEKVSQDGNRQIVHIGTFDTYSDMEIIFSQLRLNEYRFNFVNTF